MTSFLIHADQGIPLVILARDQYPAWLAKQPSTCQNWLQSLNFNGDGLALLPDPGTGQLQQAVYGVANSNDWWLAGNLSQLLPKGQYLIADPELRLRVALAFALGGYRFEGYKKQQLSQAQLVIPDYQQWQQLNQQWQGIQLTRDLINRPANDMMPEHLSQAMQTLALEFGGQFTELVGDQLLAHNYPSIHMVGRASVHPPRLLDLHWGQPQHPRVTLVGKGVCFDSGGLDLKGAAGMRNMKKDMGGAAHVLGLAHLIMSFALPIRLRVLVPAVENAVAGNAFRPGDLLTTRKGLTVEIDNTDAEGRLVLADALAEACNDKPELLIDFATLTGACRVALGTELPGFFAQSRSTAHTLIELGDAVADPVWQLPLHAPYADMLKSDIADLVNSASSPYGGAITAALYLQHFVEPDTDWLHFDVMAWNLRPLPGRPVGGEAMGLRAAFELISKRYPASSSA